jgi:hypothetical protein
MKISRLIVSLIILVSFPAVAPASSFSFTFSGDISDSWFSEENPGFSKGDAISGYGRINYTHMPALLGQASPGAKINQYSLANFSSEEFVSYELHFNGISLYSSTMYGTLIISDQSPSDKLGYYNNFGQINLLEEYDAYSETYLSFCDKDGATFTDSSLPLDLNPLLFTTGYLGLDIWGDTPHFPGLGYLGNICVNIKDLAFSAIPTPEPAAGLLVLSGTALIIRPLRKKRSLR